MAEEDFEEEIDDIDTDEGDDIDFDEEDPAEGSGDEADMAQAPSSGLLTRRRIIIISIILGSVFLLSALLFGLRLMGGGEKKKTQSSKNQAISTQKGNTQVTQEVSKKKKKKKKKIKYVKLYDLDRGSITDVLRELSYADITFKSEQRGKTFTVSVDQDELVDALNILALKGLPASDKVGYALLDDAATLGVTEFDKKVRFVRALAGELEKAIIQLDAVDNAKVQIVLPKERLFSVTQPPVTASILIRKRTGYDVTDDIIFGIIQLVANSVENLQQENVSVVDTQGMVLSSGIFERMALREAGLEEEAPLEEIEIIDELAELSPEFGVPIIPDFDHIKNWYRIKKKYEKELEEKAYQQLGGILPLGSYKVAITSEIGALDENGEIIDIRLLTTSIVVDSNREDLFMTAELKQQIFKTIAGTIGYVRGRDTIQLNLADFSLFTQEEKEKIQEKATSGLFWKRVRQLLFYPLIPVGLIAAYFGVKKFRKRRVSGDDEDSTEFMDLQGELQTEKRWDDIREIADTDPERLAAVMEEWLSAEKEEVLT